VGDQRQRATLRNLCPTGECAVNRDTPCGEFLTSRRDPAGVAGAHDMPDTPVAPSDGGPYDPLMEARVSRLEEDMREVKATLPRMEAAIVRIEATLAATLPHLATKADLAELKAELKSDIARLDADKPGKVYMWGILAVLLTAYACGLAGLAVLK
jgi:hypothetical protein